MYEEPAERLLSALTAAFGTAPQWELTLNRSYGFYLHYDGDVSISEVRAVIEATFQFSIGVILAPRGPRPGELPPMGGTSA